MLLVQRKPHQSICSNAKALQKKPDEAPKRGVEKENQSDEEEKQNQNLTTTMSSSPTKVLLQTATTYAFTSQNGEAVPVCVLLDSGSHQSYATNYRKKRLGLQPVKKETLHLNTFKQDKFKIQQCDVVNLNLKDKEGNDIKVMDWCCCGCLVRWMF